jgi:hypothetical protein
MNIKKKLSFLLVYGKTVELFIFYLLAIEEERQRLCIDKVAYQLLTVAPIIAEPYYQTIQKANIAD